MVVEEEEEEKGGFPSFKRGRKGRTKTTHATAEGTTLLQEGS